LGILTDKTTNFSPNIAAGKLNFKSCDSPVGGQIKEGIVAAMKSRFDELVVVENGEAEKELKRLKRTHFKPKSTPGSGKKSRSKNVKKTVTDSSQKKILDFYRGLNAKETDSGDS